MANEALKLIAVWIVFLSIEIVSGQQQPKRKVEHQVGFGCHNGYSHISQCGARWIKLNQNPVCYGGKGNSYGSFKIDNDVLIHKVKFVYRSGEIFCTSGAGKKGGYFGCSYSGVKDYFTVYLTDTTNTLIVPAPPVFSSVSGWYRVHGHKTFATTLTLSTGTNAFGLKAGQYLRIWHGEDLYNNTEDNNSGKTCTDIYGLV